MRLSSVTTLFAVGLLLAAAAPAASALALSRPGPAPGRGCDPGRVELETVLDGTEITGIRLIAEKSTRFRAAKQSRNYAGAAQGCQGSRFWIRLNYVYRGVSSVAYASLPADANYTVATGTPGLVRFNETTGDFYTRLTPTRNHRARRVAPLAITEERLVSTSVIMGRATPKNF